MEATKKSKKVTQRHLFDIRILFWYEKLKLN